MNIIFFNRSNYKDIMYDAESIVILNYINHIFVFLVIFN